MPRRDLIRSPLPTDDPDLLYVTDAARILGLEGEDLYVPIFEGEVLGGPDREWRVRISVSGLRAWAERTQRPVSSTG